MAATIYYDGECPFCTRYVSLLRLRDTVGDVALVNLRDDAAQAAALTAEGYDLDQGMVVDLDGKRVGGADATHLLATLSTKSGVFNRINRAAFSLPALSGLIYPVLRSGRWFTLFLMGRTTINDTKAVVANRQRIFALLFALFSLFHVFNYLFEYGRWPVSADMVVLFVSALLLLLRPASPRLLFLLILVSTISTVIQAPANSNHTMLRSMFLIGYWLSFIYAMARARPVADVFANAVLAGRGALLVMYFYGIFHKINTGFLDPEVSCAAALWDQMLPPLSWVQSVYMDYAAIYGTFIVEGLLIIALLVPRTRHIGMVGGICFHVLLSFSNFAAYISFTTLTISMHVLFLSATQIDRINGSADMAWLTARAQTWTNKLAFLMLLFGGGMFMMFRDFNIASLCLLPTVIAVCTLVMRHGRLTAADPAPRHTTAALVIGGFVTLLYFVNGAMPYAGLKTAQTVNMFSNLRLEGGVSNHLVFSDPPAGYVQDVVIPTAWGEAETPEVITDPIFGVVYYELLAELDRNPDLRVSFERNGQVYDNVSAADLRDEIDTTLHHPLIRKYFHFINVILPQPQPCA